MNTITQLNEKKLQNIICIYNVWMSPSNQIMYRQKDIKYKSSTN